MSFFQSFFAAVAAVTLFLYGLQGFSRELQTVGGSAMRSWLERITANRWLGFLIGAGATLLVQSSSAVSSLAVSLVEAATISFRASLGILLGANVGTTGTAWLVSFKLTGIGPVFIVLGSLLSLLPARIRIIGKAVFYFGLIFFALDLISTELRPLQNHPGFAAWVARADAPWAGALVGILFTALVQSSSVTTGLAIVLVQQGLLPAESAVPIVLGANVGSTSTALIAGLGLGHTARATAVANTLFNVGGLLLYAPFLGVFSRVLVRTITDPAMAVALAHTIFNLSIALVFLVFLDPTERFLRQRLKVGSGK